MNETEDTRTCRRSLVACGILIWLLCVAIFLLSDRFAEQIPNIQRPLLLVLGLLTVMFGVYLWALRCVIRSSGAYGRWIIGFGILFRVTLLGSEPIQEVDIYRYIWDGNVAAQGVSPFAYTPQQVLDAHAEFAEGDLADLLALRDSSPAIERVLKRIHFRELPTIYPTVSQWVFRLAAMSTPDGANFETHVVVMKGWLVVFDLLTVVTMWLLLQRVGSSTNWILAYWWCPLLLKEFANSGHLDSIAVFLTVLAVYLAVGSFGAAGDSSTQGCRAARGSGRAMMQFGLSCLLLGLAVGAKLYPLALVPLFGFVGYRRLNLSCAAVGMVVLAITVGAVMWPLLGPENLEAGALAAGTDLVDEEVDPFLTTAPANHDSDRAYGLKVFLGHWKMNDFIFLILSENLTPDSMSQRRWFVVVPDAWRVAVVEGFETQFGIPAEQVPFVVTRGLTAAAFMVIAFIFARRAASSQHVDVFLEAAFLSLAWFWLLSPTLNPWYWSWALPFIPFARGRAWYGLSGLVLLYYLRFYFDSHWPNLAVWGTSYRGVAFYDFVVVWLIYAPWFLWLAGGWWLRNRPVA